MNIDAHFDTKSNHLAPESIELFQENGFIRVRGLISPEEVEQYKAAVEEALFEERKKDPEQTKQPVFEQRVGLWQQYPKVKSLSLHPRIVSFAKQLTGVPMQYWHDHALVKHPHNGKATEFHQDGPYWPFSSSSAGVACWVALVDVPEQRGCMSFLPGTHKLGQGHLTVITENRAFYNNNPEQEYEPHVTVPLRAGDCTFHNGLTAHRAGANNTDEERLALISMFMAQDTVYDGRPHILTDNLNLPVDQTIDHELFPRV